MAIGSVEPLKRLHDLWGHRVHFVDVLVRQAHPGPAEPAYVSHEQKMADAERYQRSEQIPWPVVVDDLEGTLHQAYGGLANPTYLIGTDGRVSFYAPVTGAPRLHRALEELMAGGGRGMVSGGIDLVPHLLPTFSEGWRALGEDDRRAPTICPAPFPAASGSCAWASSYDPWSPRCRCGPGPFPERSGPRLPVRWPPPCSCARSPGTGSEEGSRVDDALRAFSPAPGAVDRTHRRRSRVIRLPQRPDQQDGAGDDREEEQGPQQQVAEEKGAHPVHHPVAHHWPSSLGAREGATGVEPVSPSFLPVAIIRIIRNIESGQAARIKSGNAA